jgi:hypothetical protein
MSKDILTTDCTNGADRDRHGRPFRRVLKADHASRAYKAYGTFANYCFEVHGISKCLGHRILSGRRSRRKSISESLRWRIWERDNFKCHYCGWCQFLTVDHRIPVSRGGTDDESNLVTACEDCNRSKGNMSEEDFKAAWRMGTEFCMWSNPLKL